MPQNEQPRRASNFRGLLDDAGPVGAEPGKGLGGYPLALADQAQQQMLGAEIVVAQAAGLLLGQVHRPVSPLGEPLEWSL